MGMGCIFRCKQPCPPLYQDIAQARPIIVILINDQRDFRPHLDVASAPQLPRGNTLGLLVQWSIEARAIKGIADGYNIRVSVCVSRGKPRNTLCTYKCRFRSEEH